MDRAVRSSDRVSGLIGLSSYTAWWSVIAPSEPFRASGEMAGLANGMSIASATAEREGSERHARRLVTDEDLLATGPGRGSAGARERWRGVQWALL